MSVVEDIEVATEFYGRTLGFVQAFNDSGAMDYVVTSDEFAFDAGFVDQGVEVRVRFLRHPACGIFLELMRYVSPSGGGEIASFPTHALGGPRHIALTVADAREYYEFLKTQPDVRFINESDAYGPPKHLPSEYKIAFFYWVDPWGVQWEMEEGRPVGDVKGIVG